MIRKAKINNAVYREDYNVLVLDVYFYDNEESKRLVFRAGQTTKDVADKNCQSMVGKDIKLDMSAEFPGVSEKDKVNDAMDASFRNYPFAESVAMLKEDSPECFPQDDEDEGDPVAWYAFPEEKQFNEKPSKKKKRRKLKIKRRKNK